jgi:SET domain-containing protein
MPPSTSGRASTSTQKTKLPFEVRPSPIQGLGGFATRRIRKGDRIVEYVGERITDEQADDRYDDTKMERHHTFLFSLGDGTAIDAAVGGNEARFINHSCAPNCEAVQDEDRIFIEAVRDIEPGEELFYDYAYERGGDPDEDDEDATKLYACRCGAPNCRGTILAPPPEKKKKSAAGARKQKKKTGAKADKTQGRADKTRAKAEKTRASRR